METYSYSAKNNAFYANSLKASYSEWPDDAEGVEGAIFSRFTQSPPDGKVRVAGNDGLPTWADLPPLSQEEQVAIAEAEKVILITEASNLTGIWQTQLMLGIISDSDKKRLTDWMKYIQAVQAIDTGNVQDINWPQKPE